MAKRRTYDAEVKAQVIAARLAGQRAEKVARAYQIPVRTVRSWKAKATADDGVATQRKEEIGALLMEYLAVLLRTLRKQTELFADEDWLREQDASSDEASPDETASNSNRSPAKYFIPETAQSGTCRRTGPMDSLSRSCVESSQA